MERFTSPEPLSLTVNNAGEKLVEHKNLSNISGDVNLSIQVIELEPVVDGDVVDIDPESYCSFTGFGIEGPQNCFTGDSDLYIVV